MAGDTLAPGIAGEKETKEILQLLALDMNT